jgi:hypothetical protein
MSSPNQSEKKELYKNRIRRYLPKTWEEHEIDEFLDRLFEGLEENHNPKFRSVLLRYKRRGFFKWVDIYNEWGKKIRKYFPNISTSNSERRKQ